MIVMAEATRMVMKSHSYFRTKMLYLTNNEYKNFNIKGYTATNEKGAEKNEEKGNSQ